MNNLIEETILKLNKLLSEQNYLIERITFDMITLYGTLEGIDQNLESVIPSNKKISRTNDSRYTFVRYEGLLFKFMIKDLQNEIKFGVYDIKTKKFNVDEKLDTSINMIKFWPKFFFIIKELTSQYHYNYFTLATVEHTKPLYKMFVTHKNILNLFHDMGFDYQSEKTKEEGPNTIRYYFKNINNKEQSKEELIKIYFSKLEKLKEQIPSFVKAYDETTKQINTFSEKELEEINDDLDSVLLKELKQRSIMTEHFNDGLYVKVVPTKESMSPIIKLFKSSFPKLKIDNNLHITILYSITKQKDSIAYQCEQSVNKLRNLIYETSPIQLTFLKSRTNNNSYLVLLVKDDNLKLLNSYFVKCGYKEDYNDYKAHITLCSELEVTNDELSDSIKMFNKKLKDKQFVIKYSRVILDQLES